MKRLIDIVISGCALVATAPLIAALLLVVAFTLGRPVLFRQPRSGKHGKVFELIKLRTMTGERGDDGELLADDRRLPAVGKWLRATSLDEIPALWNVLRGDMSLVGPRPLLVEYADRYSAKHARRLEVSPGVTGWAQVKGRNLLGWSERFDLDVWYVDHRSFLLDLKILAMTFTAVLSARGVNPEGGVPMPKFSGYDDA